MNLDHFRPQNHFPELESDPTNLVLSCAKCNSLKSDWWPEKDGTAEGGRHGFVDPFSNHMLSYVHVDDSGSLTSLKMPSQYMIDIMALNRPARRQIRRARRVRAEAFKLMEDICSEIEALAAKPKEEFEARIPVLSQALKDIRELLQSLG